MRIVQIAIQNFRGVSDKQIIPLTLFSAIVGKNDSGKSIIVNAIGSFLDPKTYKIVESDFHDPNQEIILECLFFNENMKDIIRNKIKSKFKKDDGLEELLDDIVLDNHFCFQRKSKKSGSDFSSNSFLMKSYVGEDFENLYAKTDEKLNDILEKYSISIPVAGTGRNSKIEKIKHIKEYCKKNSIQQENMWIEDNYKLNEVFPAIEMFVSDYGLEADTKFKTNSVSEIKSFFDNETSDHTKRLSQIENDIALEMSREAEAIKILMADYAPSIQEVVITPDINWVKAIDGVNVKFKFDGDGLPILMSHKGAGYRRLFMVARFRYLTEKNKGSNVVYLIEEPETFLHPSAQLDLLEALQQLSEKNQIVITTHSPVFAGSVKSESIILCTKDKTTSYESVDEENKSGFIEKIIHELGIKPHYNLRDSFEKIVFVEGKDDIIFYNKLSENLLEKSLIDNEKILVLPYGGSCVNSFVNIKYFLKQGRSMYLLLDSDKGLKTINPRQIDNQKNTFNEFNSRSNCKAYLLKKSAIENYWHPRAVERLLNLNENALSFFSDDENMDKAVKEISQTHSKRLSKKSNIKIFDIMEKTEYEEVVEVELLSFLEEILNS